MSRLIVGVDEAGRGPVIGPLVMAAAALDEQQLEALVELGVDDSKRLSAKRREALDGPLRELLGGFELRVVTPAEIDGSALTGGLDVLEAEVAAELIARLQPAVAIVDAVGQGGHRHRQRIVAALRRRQVPELELVVENKADARYPIVGAASILAKVARDAALSALRETHGELGSGYPSDPKTRAAVARAAQAHVSSGAPLPGYLRKRWGTVTRALDEARQGRLFPSGS